MQFSEFESKMNQLGIKSLAEIARTLKTTPQAVSNWKARDQVPHHIVVDINNILQKNTESNSFNNSLLKPMVIDKDNFDISNFLLIIAEQIKVITVIFFLCVFISFTYVQFILEPIYISRASILIPEDKSDSMGGLAGLASQFGANIPSEASADLSNPSLYPELLKSRTFSKSILDKEFFLNQFGKKLSLLEILTHGQNPPKYGRDTLITQATQILNSEYISYIEDLKSPVSIIEVKASDPIFAKKLADVILSELDALSRYYKTQNVNEKISFIENRISSVQYDLKLSEKILKDFDERNRQISSPALKLEQDRLERDVEVQKGIYLTLKQQLELAKIEEIQETSIFQVLDQPQVAISPSNKNSKTALIFSGIFGIGLGIVIAIIRSFFQSNDIEERKKIRKIKFYFNKKFNEIATDRRITGSLSLLLTIFLPYYISYESSDPIYFGKYSLEFLIINIIYIITLISSTILFLLFKKSKN